MLLCDTYINARSLDEAFDAMASHRGQYRIVAGATDILPWAREGRAGDVHIPALIDISRIPEMSARKIANGKIELGACTPIQRFLDNPELAQALPTMPRCAIWFADDQIRELATVGGNLVNASPAGDTIPCLIAQDAVLQLAVRRDGTIARRSVKLEDFITGPGKTRIEDGELLVSLECPSMRGYGGSFEKVGHRRSLVISVVCLAVLVRLDASGRTVEDVRMSIAGVGPVPSRLRAVEDFLRGQTLSARRIEDAAQMPSDVVQSRTRQEYRRDVVPGFIARGLINAAKRAGADPSVFGAELEAAYA